MVPYKLLVVARTQSLAKRLQDALGGDQHLIRWVPSTSQALALDFEPSLLLLDLPPSGGSRSVAWLKEQFNSPLIALPRPGLPFPAGVDASLPHPWTMAALTDLIQSTLMASMPDIVQVGALTLDRRAMLLQVQGASHVLRPTGCRILALLMARAGSVVSRDEIFHRAWHTDDRDHTRVLDVHIAYLRRLIEPDPSHPTWIRTERGIGYWLEAPD
jgi:two-component system, OmpR family, KDP operon response regulator KdpE